jgi:hypothetical protein
MLIAQQVGCQLSDRVSCNGQSGCIVRLEEMGVAGNTAHHPRIVLGVGWEQDEGQNLHLGKPIYHTPLHITPNTYCQYVPRLSNYPAYGFAT